MPDSARVAMPGVQAPESSLYGPIMIAVSRTGARVFRNHVGVSQHDEDRTIRHGLPPGSSDLIGWTSDGRFLAIEVKRPSWRPTPKWRASRQAAFLKAVNDAGGVAFVAVSPEHAVEQLEAQKVTTLGRR